MNMPIAEINRRNIQTQSFAAEQVMFAVNMDQQNASDVLDKHFPLQNGSHKDVKQYVVYFRHIMAFFADGSHCGLAQGQQFVGFLGHSDSPAAILLKQDNVHVEMIISKDAQAPTGQDVRLTFPEEKTFATPTGDDYEV